MTLAEWSNLTEERHRQLILQWHQEGQADAYQRLAMEAVQLLRKELKAVREIHYIAAGSNQLDGSHSSPVLEHFIVVSTLQPESFRIDCLPARFMGFRVWQINHGDWPAAYIRVWKRLFKEIRGWSEEQTLEWVKKWEGGLQSHSSIIFSSGPDKLAAPSLIDDETKAVLGFPSRAFSDLSDEIRHLITEKELYGPSGSGTGYPPLVRPGALDEYDWDDVRRRIRDLVEKYREKQE